MTFDISTAVTAQLTGNRKWLCLCMSRGRQVDSLIRFCSVCAWKGVLSTSSCWSAEHNVGQLFESITVKISARLICKLFDRNHDADAHLMQGKSPLLLTSRCHRCQLSESRFSGFTPGRRLPVIRWIRRCIDEKTWWRRGRRRNPYWEYWSIHAICEAIIRVH